MDSRLGFGFRALWLRELAVAGLGSRNMIVDLRSSRLVEFFVCTAEVVKLASGVQYIDLRVGRGEADPGSETLRAQLSSKR